MKFIASEMLHMEPHKEKPHEPVSDFLGLGRLLSADDDHEAQERKPSRLRPSCRNWKGFVKRISKPDYK